MGKNKSKGELFIKLSKPSKKGISRWVNVSEFVGEFSSLTLGNGCDWCRKETALAKKYIVERDKSISSGNKIDRIRLNGFRAEKDGSQYIRPDIIKEIKKKRCLVLDTSNPVPDHKDGRKEDLTVMTSRTQKLSDFQPLSETANYAKRQHCKVCRETGNRYDAKNLGYPVSVTEGKLKYQDKLACVGCFWYDPLAFRKKLAGKND